ncbi:MAG TPA: DUF3558 family protein [Corynebacteriales bacterium]|nr:DUF3558 family protein [Mycobacteriales bacterium]
MSALATARLSTVRRIIAGVCAVGLAFGATACQQDAEEPLIHAQHDKGAAFGRELEDMNSVEEFRKIGEQTRKWGAEQTPEWLEICNTINRKALRNLGFDPQNDLENRDGEFKNVCAWSNASGEYRVTIGSMDAEMDEINRRSNFSYMRTVEVDGREVSLGSMHHKVTGAISCSGSFSKNDTNFVIAYISRVPDQNIDELCDGVVQLAKDN